MVCGILSEQINTPNRLTTIDTKHKIYIDEDRFEVAWNMANKYEHNAKLFKAFSDPNRLLIIEMLQSGERCACEILEDLDISQSTLSHHMKILCDSGIVNCRRQSKWMYYSLCEANCQEARNFLTEITSMKDLGDIRAPRPRC